MSQWGRINSGQTYGILCVDIDRALAHLGPPRLEAMLLQYVRETSWGVARWKQRNKPWPEFRQVALNVSDLARLWNVSRARLQQAKTNLIDKRVLVESTPSGLVEINKNVEQWIGITEESLDYARKGIDCYPSEAPETDQPESITCARPGTPPVPDRAHPLCLTGHTHVPDRAHPCARPGTPPVPDRAQAPRPPLEPPIGDRARQKSSERVSEERAAAEEPPPPAVAHSIPENPAPAEPTEWAERCDRLEALVGLLGTRLRPLWRSDPRVAELWDAIPGAAWLRFARDRARALGEAADPARYFVETLPRWFAEGRGRADAPPAKGRPRDLPLPPKAPPFEMSLENPLLRHPLYRKRYARQIAEMEAARDAALAAANGHAVGNGTAPPAPVSP